MILYSKQNALRPVHDCFKEENHLLPGGHVNCPDSQPRVADVNHVEMRCRETQMQLLAGSNIDGDEPLQGGIPHWF